MTTLGTQEYERRGGKPLKEVWFQLDNTCRENKNQYVVSFLQWLVHMGFCEKATMFFLPVG